MGKKTKEEKLKIVDELAVALAPYLWNRSWGFGLNMYFDDVHVDFREMNSYIYSETQAEDESVVLGGLEYAMFGSSNTELFYEMFGNPVFSYDDVLVFKSTPQS